MRTILLATTNKGKLKEIRQILAGVSARWIGLDELDSIPEAIEDGNTFEQNAAKKALHYAGLSKLWTLADDSGLEVDALNGAPGVHSARYAGAAADDQANNAKLIASLRDVDSSQRSARYYCAVALARPGELLATSSGTMEGVIVSEARGDRGFGYDPHFYVPSHQMTAAEMSPELKNRLSHRGEAFREMRSHLDRHFRQDASETA